ncbi:MAG: glycosyltransferase [Elusimicrobiota bacterium]
MPADHPAPGQALRPLRAAPALLSSALALLSLLGSAGLWVCLAVTRRHFRGAPPEACARPMTLIKPIKGRDDAMEDGFRAIVAADPGRTLQVLIALETADDPAYPVARAFADAHPDRDIEVVLTGPSGPRMGKIHNMIEAAPRAKHRVILFSDADVRITPTLLSDTARAFDAGADAVYALPYHAFVSGPGGWLFLVAFNHSFCVPVALTYRLGKLRSFAGAWMGYTKEALAAIGGLERFENAIAEDFSLGLAASRAGLRQVLLREPVLVRETGTSVSEAFTHISKWTSIIFWSWPAPVIAAPFASPCLLGYISIALAVTLGLPVKLSLFAVSVAALSRIAVGVLQDEFLSGSRAPFWSYALLPIADLGALIFLPLALRRTVTWRGKTYRLTLGGHAEVVA